MRLSRKEIETILKVANEIYGKGVKVYLFGSRTDDNKRGGDIDLLLRTPQSNGAWRPENRHYRRSRNICCSS